MRDKYNYQALETAISDYASVKSLSTGKYPGEWHDDQRDKTMTQRSSKTKANETAVSSQVWTLSKWVAIPEDNQAVSVAQETAVSTAIDFDHPLGALVHTAVLAASQSPNTQRAYKTSIGQFFVFLGGALGAERPLAEAGRNGRSVMWAFRGTADILRHIKPSHLDGFRSWLMARELSVNAIESRYAAVKTFLSVCFRDGYLTDEQARRLDIRPFKARVRRDEKPVGRRLTRAEVKKLRAAVPTHTLKGKRDLAILDCMLYGGLRRDEVGSLRIGDLQQDGGRYWLIVQRGKGNKTRRIKVADPLFRSLTSWVDAARKTLAYKAPIFEGIDRHGNLSGIAVDGSTVGRIVNAYGAAARIAMATGVNQLSAHDLRRTAARNAHDNGAPLLIVQKFLGHRDPKTTARYIGLNEDDSDTAVDYIRY